ncbi:MAG: hypothetical protein AB1Z23_08400 [Eubacteriales bacterium]
MKDFLRKQIVNLKRAPQRIPLVILVICCIIYTFSLTEHSNASMYVNANITALYVFIITLSSMLAIFSYINAYSGGKVHKGMLIVAIAIILIQVLFGVLYLKEMFYETTLRESPVPITPDIAKSMNMTMIHLVSLGFALLVILLKPLYHKALLQIDTTRYDVDDSNIIDDVSIYDEFPDEDELNW